MIKPKLSMVIPISCRVKSTSLRSNVKKKRKKKVSPSLVCTSRMGPRECGDPDLGKITLSLYFQGRNPQYLGY